MPSGIYRCLYGIEKKIIENKDFLTELDRLIGDADHGINMARGFSAVTDKLPPEENDIGKALKTTGMTLLSKVGGASGPLYATAFMEVGKILEGKTEITNPEDFNLIFNAAIAGIKKRGQAVKGEKTMLDAFIPASETYAKKISEGSNMIDAFEAACASAREGVEFTKTIIATKGRASYLGDRSIGHQDPGATSATLILEAILEYLKNK